MLLLRMILDNFRIEIKGLLFRSALIERTPITLRRSSCDWLNGQHEKMLNSVLEIPSIICRNTRGPPPKADGCPVITNKIFIVFSRRRSSYGYAPRYR